MKKLDLDALENVAGGLALHGIAAAGTVPGTNPTTPFSTVPGTGVQPFGGDPGFGGMYGGFGGMEGHGGHHHLGHEAMREFTHDPTFQNALSQFETQHPELAASFAPLQQGDHHGMWQVMHDPNGRAALDQFFHDPSFAGAYQQFAGAHPDLAGPLAHMIQHTEFRLENGGQPGYGYGGGYGQGYPGYGGFDQFGGIQSQGVAANGAAPSDMGGVGIDPASLGLPTTF